MRTDFAVIVNSHGRPDFSAAEALRRAGYTGQLFITVDDEDDKILEYVARFGGQNIRIFHKECVGDYDVEDNFSEPMGVVMFARNEAWKMAFAKGLKYFFVMDDDLKSISYRAVKGGKLKSYQAHGIDSCFEAICDFMESDSRIFGIGFGFANDYIGGAERFEDEFGKKRLIMNGYFCKTERKYSFDGRVCEDSITSLNQARAGKIFLNITSVMMQYNIWMPNKKQGKGGMQDTYKKMSSYAMRCYALMSNPSCVKIKQVENGFDTMIQKQYAYPKILSSRCKK